MSISTVLFDLDGTLLPMDQDAFWKACLKGLSEKVEPLGYEPMTFTATVWKGIVAMVDNKGEMTNEEAFWKVFTERYGKEALKDLPVFNEFYEKEFQNIKEICGCNPLAAYTVNKLKKEGFRLALATSPVFPRIATESRIRWAGLSPDDFELYTTYENSCTCKPHTSFYREVLKTLGVNAEECLMVGNDVDEDMVAETLDMKVFLITDCLINRGNEDISVYPNGSFERLLEYIDEIK